jgi:carbonic anhydrase
MELHFVHGTPDGKLAVLGVFVKGGGSVPNAEFDKILNNLPTEMQLDETGESANVTDPDDLVTGVNVDIKKLLPKNKKKFFAYAGSLTTPPCSEGVNWYVLAEPIVVSDEQITKYQSYANSYGFFPGNRPTQLIGDRKVIQPNVNSMDWGVVE